jgi:hypothetical protein
VVWHEDSQKKESIVTDRNRALSSSGLNRRAALWATGATAAVLGLGSRLDRASAQEAAGEAPTSHPIVGAWLVRNPTDPPTASAASFSADGIMTIAWVPSYADPQLGAVFQATAIGSWEPTGEPSIRFTVVQALSGADGTYLGTFTLDGSPEVSEDGLSFLDEGTTAKVTIRDADDRITFEAGGVEGEEPVTPPVHAKRIQIGDPGFPAATPTASTPTA